MKAEIYYMKAGIYYMKAGGMLHEGYKDIEVSWNVCRHQLLVRYNIMVTAVF